MKASPRNLTLAVLFSLGCVSAQVQVIPQVADGAGWATTIALTNTTATAQTAMLKFSQSTGTGGATLPWTPPFMESGVSLNAIVLHVGATLFLHTPGTAAALTQGWGELDAAAGVVGYAIFTAHAAGNPVQDATAPAVTAASRILVPFDNTSGLITAVAVVNPNASAETIAVNIRTSDGAVNTNTLPSIPTKGQRTFLMPTQFTSTAGKSGLAEFYTNSGTISIIALRANPSGAFTSAPVYSETGPPIIGASTFTYGSLFSGAPRTLFPSVQSLKPDGTVVISGADYAQPLTPFKFSWGDGSSTSGFFPQQHLYENNGKNYQATITATENSGAIQEVAIPVFFTAPPVTPQTLPSDVSFQIPSQAVQLGTHYSYPLPTGETVFNDSAFAPYSRASMAYILAAAAVIDKDFANDNVYLTNGLFAIEMLQNVSFAGESFWYTTPLSVGYSLAALKPSIQWFILFNEIGKDTVLNTPLTLPYGGNTDGNASEIYSETMGDIFSYATGYELINNAASHGIGEVVALDIGNSMLTGAGALKANFDSYVAAGAPFSSWNPFDGGPDPTLGAVTSLAWKFIQHAEQQGVGYRAPVKRLMKFLQLFNPSMLASYDPRHNTQVAATFRSTLMITALSYAFSQDLRSEFRALNFPIDDGIYQQLYADAPTATGH